MFARVLNRAGRIESFASTVELFSVNEGSQRVQFCQIHVLRDIKILEEIIGSFPFHSSVTWSVSMDSCYQQSDATCVLGSMSKYGWPLMKLS